MNRTAPHPLPTTSAPTAVAWPFVGRGSELRRAELALSGGPSGVLISGSAGIGKTRLAASVARICADSGLYVVAGSISAVAHRLGLGDVPLSAADLNPTAIAGRLLDCAEGRAVVLTLDDAEQLDRGSARVLYELMELVDLRLVLTSETNGSESSPLAELSRLLQVEPLPLAGLTRATVRELLTVVLGNPPDELTVHRIWTATAGNPLLIRSLVNTGLEQNLLVERHGRWQWPTDLVVTVELTPAQREALEYLTVAEQLPLGVLHRVATEAVVTSLVTQGLAVTNGTNVWPTAPAATIGNLRRRRYFRTLLDGGLGGVGAARVGWWRVEADLGVEAAGVAAEVLAAGDACVAARLARDAGDEAALTLAQAQLALGQSAETLRTLVVLEPQDAAVAALRELAQGRIAETADLELPVLRAAATFAAAQQQLVDGQFARLTPAVHGPWTTLHHAHQACEVRALIQTGRLREAEQLAAWYYAETLTSAGSVELTSAGLAVLGHAAAACASWAGDHARAWPILQEVRALLNKAVPLSLQVEIRSDYAAGAAAVGVLDLAVGELDELQQLDLCEPLYDRIDHARIRMLCHSGRRAYAADLADQLASRCLAAGRRVPAIEAAYYQVRLNPSTAGALRLEQLAAETDSPLFALFAAHGRALTDRDPRELLHLANEFSDRGYVGLGLAAGESALRTPAAYAVQVAVKREVADLRARWSGGPQYSAIGMPPPTRYPLTTREREACELAASGLRNAAIAARLGISVRTVANLLARAYQKLDVTSRRELQSAMSLVALPVTLGPEALQPAPATGRSPLPSGTGR